MTRLGNTDGDLTPEAAEAIHSQDRQAGQRVRQGPRQHRGRPQRRVRHPLARMLGIVGVGVLVMIVLCRRDKPEISVRASRLNTDSPPREPRAIPPGRRQSAQSVVPKSQVSRSLEPALPEQRPSGYESQGIDRGTVEAFVNSWKKAWESRDIDAFMRFYDQSFYSLDKQQDYQDYRDHKQKLFGCYEYIRITLGQMDIWIQPEQTSLDSRSGSSGKQAGGQVMVRFLQHYQSDQYEDKGVKILYLVRNDDGLRIVGEDFHKH